MLPRDDATRSDGDGGTGGTSSRVLPRAEHDVIGPLCLHGGGPILNVLCRSMRPTAHTTESSSVEDMPKCTRVYNSTDLVIRDMNVRTNPSRRSSVVLGLVLLIFY